MLTVLELKSLLKTHDLRLTKRRGQNYLIDAQAIRRVVDACELSGEETVVEIGAGLGALTEPLAERARHVIAIEVDRGIAALLRGRLAGRGHVDVQCADMLEMPWPSPHPAVVVGAIPYHITSQIVARLCEERRAIQRAVLIVQEEVADRLTARPGTKAYGRLSVLMQWSWEATRIFRLARSAFFPQPDVDSSCLRLRPQRQPPAAVDNETVLFEVVKTAFSHRRKTLINCLCDSAFGLARSHAAALVERAGLPPHVRGETLSLAQFAALANAISSGSV
ncbi:MAG: ribosomal RNA small subunit methyltransferase A [Candidatus Omnitrophica bacterium]|nr:ribosomal RNA small subunit methyltransferase A [Candidatus Omnitrophota bacterium]